MIVHKKQHKRSKNGPFRMKIIARSVSHILWLTLTRVFKDINVIRYNLYRISCKLRVMVSNMSRIQPAELCTRRMHIFRHIQTDSSRSCTTKLAHPLYAEYAFSKHYFCKCEIICNFCGGELDLL